MQCIAAVVTSKDGYITDKNGKMLWASQTDKDAFSKLLATSDVLVMGRRTFFSHLNDFVHTSNKKRLVLTSQPNKYQPYKALATFTNTPLNKSLENLTKEGYKCALIVGGQKLYYDALVQSLVDLIYITVEPITLGGGQLFLPKDTTIQDFSEYTLKKSEQTAINGTRFLTYMKVRAL